MRTTYDLVSSARSPPLLLNLNLTLFEDQIQFFKRQLEGVKQARLFFSSSNSTLPLRLWDFFFLGFTVKADTSGQCQASEMIPRLSRLVLVPAWEVSKLLHSSPAASRLKLSAIIVVKTSKAKRSITSTGQPIAWRGQHFKKITCSCNWTSTLDKSLNEHRLANKDQNSCSSHQSANRSSSLIPTKRCSI